MLGKSRGTGVTQIDIIEPITKEVTHLQNKREREEANIEHLSELFLCVNDTPLRLPGMMADFRYTSDTPAGDAVTSCKYDPPEETDEYTRLLLKISERPASYLYN